MTNSCLDAVGIIKIRKRLFALLVPVKKILSKSFIMHSKGQRYLLWVIWPLDWLTNLRYNQVIIECIYSTGWLTISMKFWKIRNHLRCLKSNDSPKLVLMEHLNWIFSLKLITYSQTYDALEKSEVFETWLYRCIWESVSGLSHLAGPELPGA